MHSKLHKTTKLQWILFAVTILNLDYCESSVDKYIGAKQKYLEVEDLNGLNLPASYTSNEESTNIHVDMLKGNHTRKIERRTPRIDIGSDNFQQIKRLKVATEQPKKKRSSFFWTLARVTFETFNDTRSAIQQISQIINESIPDELSVQKQTLATLKMKSTAAPENETENETPPTTEEPEFKLTRPLLLSLVRRNVNGLVRLFKIEWRDAISQSQKNIKEFQRDLGKQVGIYLQDNPSKF